MKPLRKIVSRKAIRGHIGGSGAFVLTLECGHKVIRRPYYIRGSRVRCEHCSA